MDNTKTESKISNKQYQSLGALFCEVGVGSVCLWVVGGGCLCVGFLFVFFQFQELCKLHLYADILVIRCLQAKLKLSFFRFFIFISSAKHLPSAHSQLIVTPTVLKKSREKNLLSNGSDLTGSFSASNLVFQKHCDTWSIYRSITLPTIAFLRLQMSQHFFLSLQKHKHPLLLKPLPTEAN